jgi:signal peptidase I
MKNGRLFINGIEQPQSEQRQASVSDGENGSPAMAFTETLLDTKKTYTVLDLSPTGYLDNTDIFTVPPQHLFVIGDNRDNSTDSRMANFGTVPRSAVVGKAFFRLYPAGGRL